MIKAYERNVDNGVFLCGGPEEEMTLLELGNGQFL